MASNPPDPLGTALHGLDTAVTWLLEAPAPPDDATAADTIGHVQHVERKLATYRKGLLVETPAGAVGNDYQLVGANKAKRTFNVMRILADYSKARDIGVLDAIVALKEAGVLRFTVLWSKLEPALLNAGIDLEVQSSELSPGADLNDPHVGVIWGETVTVSAAPPSTEAGF